MEILTTRLSLKTNLFFLFIVVFSLPGIGQQWTYVDNGNHHFESLQQPQNLSFYLFDDGYHSFSQNPHHQYGGSHKVPVHYSALPYNGGDVDDLVMDETIEYSTSATPELTFPDNQVSIKRSWELVQGKDNYYVITFENSQYTHAISGCLEFHFSKNKSDVEPTEILDHNHYDNGWVHTREYTDSDYLDEGFTNKYTWYFDNLEIGEQRYVYVKANCLPPALKRVKTRAVMKIDGTENGCGAHIAYDPKTDGNNSDVSDSNIYTDKAVVKNNPHDPNCITAEPYGLYECDVNQTITYKIYFHNDGEDPAVNVYLDIDIMAPYQNVKLIQASANCNLEWNDDKIEIVFPEIYLAGLNQTNPEPSSINETYGAVEIEVCYDLRDFTLGNLDCAHTDVAITFDNEAPIFVDNRICRNIDCTTGGGYSNVPGVVPTQNPPCPVNSPSQTNYWTETYGRTDNSNKFDSEIVISPNPGYDLINLINAKIDKNTIVYVYDNKGQKIQINNSNDLIGGNTLDISNLNSDLYFISIVSNSERKTKRFVKI